MSGVLFSLGTLFEDHRKIWLSSFTVGAIYYAKWRLPIKDELKSDKWKKYQNCSIPDSFFIPLTCIYHLETIDVIVTGTYDYFAMNIVGS